MGHGLEIVLTDTLWRERFTANPEILGQSVSLNGYPATVIGVLPVSFYFPKQDQLYNTAIARWASHVDYFLNLNLGAWEHKPGIGKLALSLPTTMVSSDGFIAAMDWKE
jgi:hypothetical protein